MPRCHCLIAALLCYAAAIAMVLLLGGCGGDNDDPGESPTRTTAKMDPTAMDDDDRALNEPDGLDTGGGDEVEAVEVAFNPETAATRMQSTYGVRNGRQAFRVSPRFGRKGQSAIVVFSDQPRRGYRVKLHYANRIHSGLSRGFVFKRGSMGDFYCHAPYSRHPNQVIVYY